MSNNSYIYTGDPITPKFTLNIGDRVLNDGTDFDVDITDNINVGTAHVVITGKGKFKGVIERTFEITPVQARSLSFFADVTEFLYTGEPCYMKVAVKFGSTTLVEGVDYMIEYINNVQPGTANAILYFMGNFVGTMTIPFNIIALVPQEEKVSEDRSTEDQEGIPDAAAADGEYFVNTSRVSRKNTAPGKKIRVYASAEGGEPPYSFAVFYKKASKKDWNTVSDFSQKTEFVVIPKAATKYRILVKAMDSTGAVAKKVFRINVSETDDLPDVKQPAE